MISTLEDPPRVIAHLLQASGAIPNHPRWLLLYPAHVPMSENGEPALLSPGTMRP